MHVRALNFERRDITVVERDGGLEDGIAAADAFGFDRVDDFREGPGLRRC
ncbi:hypothetical protein [Mycobacterium ulcerans]|nr:hypothetical protein [Mycobacterium ulcerans]